MKILITGINGQVGHAMMQQLTEHELIGLTRQNCDLINPDEIKHVIDQHQPDLIINPAAYTRVDQAESEVELAFQINRDAPTVMAEKAQECNIPFIHFSTDYVFDGHKDTAYNEADSTHPLSAYGQSKLAGEREIQRVGGKFYILRTSWIYSNIGKNFYLTIKKISQERDEIRVVSDQFGVPTSAFFIADQLKLIINKLDYNNRGIYHLVPDGQCSWYEFAEAILIKNQSKPEPTKLIPIKSSQYPTKVIRPKNSVLSNKKFKNNFSIELLNWKRYLF